MTTKIVAAANRFLDTLSADERATVQFAWTDTAQKQRWSNFPEGAFKRDGLRWGTLTAPQQQAWLAMMAATLSPAGYDRVMRAWAAEEAHAARHGGGGGRGRASFGRDYWWIALIGTPSRTNPWQWQWGGHHVTLNATIVGENLCLTPSFLGSQPATYPDANGRTVTPLGDIEETALALVNSLDPTQRAQAILGDTPIDLVLGPGQDGQTLQPAGLPAAAMNARQQERLLRLIGYYVNLAEAEAATRRLADVQSHLPHTYFAWYGPTAPGTWAYFRVTGPTILIEYAPQGRPGAGPSEHIHSVYRDPTNDYGAALVQG